MSTPWNNRNLLWVVPSVLLMAGSGVLGLHRYLHPSSQHVANLPSIEEIPDGQPLYNFLLKEVPDVVSQIPCQCCGRMLSWCYQGGCPPT